MLHGVRLRSAFAVAVSATLALDLPAVALDASATPSHVPETLPEVGLTDTELGWLAGDCAASCAVTVRLPAEGSTRDVLHVVPWLHLLARSHHVCDERVTPGLACIGDRARRRLHARTHQAAVGDVEDLDRPRRAGDARSRLCDKQRGSTRCEHRAVSAQRDGGSRGLETHRRAARGDRWCRAGATGARSEHRLVAVSGTGGEARGHG